MKPDFLMDAEGLADLMDDVLIEYSDEYDLVLFPAGGEKALLQQIAEVWLNRALARITR
jgi:hypothetical protein